MTRSPDNHIDQTTILVPWQYWPDDYIDPKTRLPDNQMNILTGWPDDQMTIWADDQMTRWPDDRMTTLTTWPDEYIDQMNRWTDDKMTRWPDDHIDQMTILTRWPDDHMTILTRSPDDQITRWPDDLMTRWPDDQMTILTRRPNNQIKWWYTMIWPYLCIETSSKTTITHCLQKRHQSPQNWHVISHTRYNDDIWWSDHTDV